MTESGTKLAAAAPGVKRSTSRKAHAIDLLNTVSVKLAHGQGLDTITEVQLLSSHQQFKQDYPGLMFVELVCELVSLFLQEGQDEPGYYRNLANLLEVKAPHKLSLLAAAVILRFLHINGTLPKLSEDVYGGEELSNAELRFPTAEIGYTSRQEMAIGDAVSDRIYKTQRFILQYDFSAINRIDLSSAEQRQLLDLHLTWLELATDRQLKSAEMFKQALSAMI